MLPSCTQKFQGVTVSGKKLLFTTEDLRDFASEFPLYPLSTVVQRLCKIWCNHPEYVIGGALFGGLSTSYLAPSLALTVNNIGQLCSGRCTVPTSRIYNPNKQPSFKGGQCPVPYRITGEARYRASLDGYEASLLWDEVMGTAFRGPLVPKVGTPVPDFGSVPASGRQATFLCYTTIGGLPTEYTISGAGTSPPGGISGHGNAFYLQWYQYICYRLDGQPDTCGDGKPSYPLPPESDFSGTTYLTENTNINVKITPPGIPVDWKITPVYPNVLIPCFITIGGNQFYFDYDGLSVFDYSTNVSIDLLVPPDSRTIPPVLSPEPNTDPSVPDNKYSPQRRNPPVETPTEPPPECTQEKVALQKYLHVTVDTSNYTGRYIFSVDGVDEVVIAGWVRFSIDDVPLGDEIPIRRLESLFPLPLGANGYRLSPLHGCALTGEILELEQDLPQVWYKCE